MPKTSAQNAQLLTQALDRIEAALDAAHDTAGQRDTTPLTLSTISQLERRIDRALDIVAPYLLAAKERPNG